MVAAPDERLDPPPNRLAWHPGLGTVIRQLGKHVTPNPWARFAQIAVGAHKVELPLVVLRDDRNREQIDGAPILDELGVEKVAKGQGLNLAD
jgi:hypothetical protein